MSDHDNFLQMVKAYVEANPEVSPHVLQYVEDGLTNALKLTRERATDMEIALSGALMSGHGRGRSKYKNELILSKLSKWQGKTSLNWDAEISLRKEKEQK